MILRNKTRADAAADKVARLALIETLKLDHGRIIEIPNRANLELDSTADIAQERRAIRYLDDLLSAFDALDAHGFEIGQRFEVTRYEDELAGRTVTLIGIDPAHCGSDSEIHIEPIQGPTGWYDTVPIGRLHTKKDI